MPATSPISIPAALLSFVALVLLAISMATNHWVDLDFPRASNSTSINPFKQNNKISGLSLRYDLDHFGIWVACHREKTFNKISCAYVGASCYSNVCWIRNDKDKKCVNSRVTPITKCSAYQAARAMLIIGALFLILGASVLLVSVCVSSRNLSTFGAVSTFFGALFLMIAFAVFFQHNYKSPNLDSIGSIGWSFILLIVSWPLAVVAALLALLASFNSSKQPQQDFEESE